MIIGTEGNFKIAELSLPLPLFAGEGGVGARKRRFDANSISLT
jgi:hypothetical protein